MEIGKVITAFLVFALFGIAIISFGINFAQENEADISIQNDSTINVIYTGINDTIYDYDGGSLQEEANDSFTNFNADTGTTGFLGSISDFFISTLLSVGKSIMGIGNAIFNVTFGPILKTLGLPNDVAKIIGIIISTIMLFTITLLAWKLYRTGS